MRGARIIAGFAVFWTLEGTWLKLLTVLLLVIAVLLVACAQSAQFEPPTVETTEVYLTMIAIPTSTAISCTEEVIADRKRHIEVVQKVRDRYESALMNVPGVVGVGTGFLRLEGRVLEDLRIIVYVAPDIIGTAGDPSNLIPLSLEGCSVLVQEVPQPEPAGVIESGFEISCTEDVIANRKRHMEILREVRQRYQGRFMAVPGVIGTGVGTVYDEGEPTVEIGIIILADAKLPPDQVDPEHVIPSSLEGCTVDVQPASPIPAVSGEG